MAYAAPPVRERLPRGRTKSPGEGYRGGHQSPPERGLPRGRPKSPLARVLRKRLPRGPPKVPPPSGTRHRIDSLGERLPRGLTKSPRVSGCLMCQPGLRGRVGLGRGYRGVALRSPPLAAPANQHTP